jgi:Icc-related predicted phosphoesterase
LVKTRLFFCTDVHGSEKCFRKFVNAGKFYSANVLVLGGDITGKVLVTVSKQTDGSYNLNYAGNKMNIKKSELEATLKNVRDSGYYPYLTDPKEVEEMKAKPELQHQAFVKMMKETLANWMALAEERLKSTGISCYISPGNDDFFDIDEILNSSSFVINPEEKVVSIDGEHEMITLGYANRTPWNSPREVDEDELAKKIDSMTSRVKDMKKAVYNLHVPPIDTPLDKAPKLTHDLKPVTSGGHTVMASAGSSAVRKSIEEHQPLTGIHGHIHESKGMVRIGRTICLNPGSEYNAGILRGLLCDLDGDVVKSYLFTSG